MIAFFPYFVNLVNITAGFLGLSEDNVALKTALFHTLFNLVGVIFISLFIRQIVYFLDKTIKAPG